MSLQEILNEKRDNSQIPTTAREIMEKATKTLKDSNILDNVLKQGDTLIDFSLPNVHGNLINLKESLINGPVILSFYRGGWCPYCNLQLKSYQDHLNQFKEYGAQLIAVSPETRDAATDTTDVNALKFEVLSDTENKVAREYGLVFQLDSNLKEVYLKFGLDLELNQGNQKWELPIPATYVIAQNGEIIYSFLNVDYIQRAEPKDIIEALKLAREIK